MHFSRSKYAALMVCLMLGLPATFPASAAILLEIPGVTGDSTVPGFLNQVVCDRLEFGVDRVPAPLLPPGFDDINIDPGHLRLLRVHKQIDPGSPLLFQNAVSGNRLPALTVRLFDAAQPKGEVPRIDMLMRLEPLFVTSWQSLARHGQRPAEVLEILYSKISLQTRGTGPAMPIYPSRGWDQSRSLNWSPPIDLADEPGNVPSVATINHAAEGEVRLEFVGIPGGTYTVERTQSLRSPIQWEQLGVARANGQGLFQWLDERAAGAPSLRVYRAVSGQPGSSAVASP